MHRFLALTRILWKNGQNPNTKKKKTAFGAAGTQAARILFLLLALLVIAACGYAAMASFPEAAAAREAALTRVFTTNTVLVLISGVPMILSYFFLSRDVPLYLHMPLRGREIVGAKLVMAMTTGVALSLLVTIPQLVGFGLGGGFGARYYVTAVVTALLLPVVPTVLIAALAIVLMHALRRVKNKESIVTMVSYAIMALVLIGPSLGGTEGGFLQGVVSNPAVRIVVTVLCPAAGLGAKALLHARLFPFLLFLALNIAAVLLFVVLADAFYIRSVLMGGGGGGTVKKSGAALDFQPRTVPETLWHKENQMFFRSTVCVMNSLTGMLAVPVILIIGLVTAFFGADEGIASLAAQPEFQAVLFAILPVLVCPIFLMIASLNRLTPSCIAREAEGYYLLKAMPIRPQTLYRAKKKTGLCLSLAVCVLTAAVLGGFLLMIGAHPAILIVLIVESAAVAVLVNNIQMIHACENPMLIWDNEETVLRQSGMLGVVLSSGAVIITGAAASALVWLAGRSAAPAAAVFGLWLIAGAVVSETVGTKKGIQKMLRIGG